MLSAINNIHINRFFFKVLSFFVSKQYLDFGSKINHKGIYSLI